MKKILCLFLCLMMLIPALISLADDAVVRNVTLIIAQIRIPRQTHPRQQADRHHQGEQNTFFFMVVVSLILVVS